MVKDYTSEKLIQFIYGECDIFERLENDLLYDIGLQNAYLRLHSAYKKLPKVKFSPSTKTVNNILAFANNQMSPTA